MSSAVPASSAAASSSDYARHSTVFHAGSNIDAMLDSVFDAQNDCMLNVMFPPQGVAEIALHLFRSDTSVPLDFSTADVLRVAAAHKQHADSARIVACQLYTRWLQGHRYTVVRSFHVPNPTERNSHDSNSSVNYTVDHSRRRRWNPDVHPLHLSCKREFVSADANNYIYRPSKEQQQKGKVCITIVSHTSKYSKVSLEQFETAMYRPRALDIQWLRAVSLALTGRMLPVVAGRLCLQVIRELSFLSEQRLDEVSFHFVREKKVKKFVLGGERKSMLVDAAGLQQFVESQQQVHIGHDVCFKCKTGSVQVRCVHCGWLRYCKESCRVADAEEHYKECKVYLRKMAGLPQPPGGAAVLKKTLAAVVEGGEAKQKSIAVLPPGGPAIH